MPATLEDDVARLEGGCGSLDCDWPKDSAEAKNDCLGVSCPPEELLSRSVSSIAEESRVLPDPIPSLPEGCTGELSREISAS